jgi:hypothetical protein
MSIKSILDKLDNEVSKLPNINRAVHDANFQQLCKEAKEKTKTEQRNQKKSFGKGKLLKESQKKKRRQLWEKYAEDPEKAAKKAGLSSRAWYEYVRNHFQSTPVTETRKKRKAAAILRKKIYEEHGTDYTTGAKKAGLQKNSWCNYIRANFHE